MLNPLNIFFAHPYLKENLVESFTFIEEAIYRVSNTGV